MSRPSLTCDPALASRAENVADRAADGFVWLSESGLLARSQANAPSSAATIQSYLEAKPDITMMRIEGHVAGMGEDGQGLSERRALAVTVGQGIECGRLLPVGFGQNKPAFGDERDTQIETVNAALRGRGIGGMPVDGGGAVAGDPCR